MFHPLKFVVVVLMDAEVLGLPNIAHLDIRLSNILNIHPMYLSHRFSFFYRPSKCLKQSTVFYISS